MNNHTSSGLTYTDAVLLLQVTSRNPTAREIETAHGDRIRDWRLRHRFAHLPEDRERAEDMFKLLPEARRVALAHVSGHRAYPHSGSRATTSKNSGIPARQCAVPAAFASAPLSAAAKRAWESVCQAMLAFLRNAGSPGRRMLATLEFLHASGVSIAMVWIIVMGGWICLLHGCVRVLSHHQ